MVTRRSLLTQGLFLAAGAGAAVLLRDHVLWPPPTLTFAERGGSGWLPFISAEVDPLVNVLAGVNNTPVRALVDTGAQISVIDRAFAAAHRLDRGLGAPMIAYGIGGGAQIARGVRLNVELGGLTIQGLNAAIVDLGPLAAASGLSTSLVIGQDALWRMAADIDFLNRRVAFHPAGAVGALPGARAAPVQRHGRGLLASVQVEGTPMELIVDTGATGYLALARGAAQDAGLLAGRRLRPAESIVLGGVSEGSFMTVHSLDFAGHRWNEVEAHIFTAPPAPGFPRGLLGIEALQGTRALLDIGAGRLDLAWSSLAKAAVTAD